MTEGVGEIKGMALISGHRVYLGIVIDPVDDTLDALAQVYEWRIGERVKVIGNESSK